MLHRERDIVVMVHGDDFVWTTDIEDLGWLERMLNEKFDITLHIIGHDEESKTQIKVLNRFISVKDGGYTYYEPDVRLPRWLSRNSGCKVRKH